MFAFDVHNLSKLAEATLSAPEGDHCYVGTMNLPHFSEACPGSSQGNPVLSRDVSISNFQSQISSVSAALLPQADMAAV
jgi:hypothetical protein